MIGDSTQVAGRSTIKKSVIGRHCVIGKMAKIVGCVLLDHCVIEDGSVRHRSPLACLMINNCIERNLMAVFWGRILKLERELNFHDVLPRLGMKSRQEVRVESPNGGTPDN